MIQSYILISENDGFNIVVFDVSLSIFKNILSLKKPPRG